MSGQSDRYHSNNHTDTKAHNNRHSFTNLSRRQTFSPPTLYRWDSPDMKLLMRKRKIPGTGSAFKQIGLGGVGTAFFGAKALGTLFGAFSAWPPPVDTAYTFAVFCLLAVICGFFLGKGLFLRKKLFRILDYIDSWRGRSFIMLSDLAGECGQPAKQVREDVQYLLTRDFFPLSVIMDEEETCLMFSDEAVHLYLSAKEAQKLRAEEEEKKRLEEERWALAPEEEKEMHRFTVQTEEVLDQIRKCEKELAAGHLYAELSRLELVLSRIFLCVKDHPEKMRLTGRLRNYYIPSVQKLLYAYEDLEKQPIQGENIQGTMKEIEESFDPINTALEAMYDELFQEEALDISTDIQVLRAMLAQDGWISPGDQSRKEKEDILG